MLVFCISCCALSRCRNGDLVYINYSQQFSGVSGGGATAASKAASRQPGAAAGGSFVAVGGGSGAGTKKGKGRGGGSGRNSNSRAEHGASGGDGGGGSGGYWQQEGGKNVSRGVFFYTHMHILPFSNFHAAMSPTLMPTCPSAGTLASPACPTLAPAPSALVPHCTLALQVYISATGRKLYGQVAYVTYKRERGELGVSGGGVKKKRKGGSGSGGGSRRRKGGGGSRRRKK